MLNWGNKPENADVPRCTRAVTQPTKTVQTRRSGCAGRRWRSRGTTFATSIGATSHTVRRDRLTSILKSNMPATTANIFYWWTSTTLNDNSCMHTIEAHITHSLLENRNCAETYLRVMLLRSPRCSGRLHARNSLMSCRCFEVLWRGESVSFCYYTAFSLVFSIGWFGVWLSLSRTGCVGWRFVSPSCCSSR